MTLLDPVPAGPPGRLVGGRYRLDRPLGGGAMGTVWRGHDTRLGRDVAVKEVVLPPALPDGERRVLRERTFREARVAARLHHPGAVEVYDVVDADGRPCLVMELVEARTLADLVREAGPLAPREAARVGLALLGALDAAHRAGVLHRDVKPGNVLVTHDGRVVLSDFGIATCVDDVRVTSTGLLLGSPAYMAPERARGRTPGPPSDLWSLGATLYACVEGRPPFDGDDPLTTLTKVVAEPPPPPLAAGPLAPLLLGLLDKDPERRLDAGRARALLTAVLGGGPADVPAQRPGRPGPPRAAVAPSTETVAVAPLRGPRRGTRAVRAVAVGLALLAAAAGGFALQREVPALQAPVTAPAGAVVQGG